MQVAVKTSARKVGNPKLAVENVSGRAVSACIKKTKEE
jgi:hypothetical protein